MSGYIDENARIADDIHNAYEEGYADGKRDAVVHGHWIWSDDLCEYCCSRCGHTDDYGIHPDIEYCPYCGAKMDEAMRFGM